MEHKHHAGKREVEAELAASIEAATNQATTDFSGSAWAEPVSISRPVAGTRAFHEECQGGATPVLIMGQPQAGLIRFYMAGMEGLTRVKAGSNLLKAHDLEGI